MRKKLKMKKVLTEQRLCELAGLQKEVEKKSHRVWNPKTKKYEYTTLEPGVDIGPTGTVALGMDPVDVVGGATTTKVPARKPPTPDPVPWGRGGPAPTADLPAPTADPEAEPVTEPQLRHRPSPETLAMMRWRNPSPEAEPVEGEPGMFWHKDSKGKHQRAGYPGNWRKLPIGVTRPSGYRLSGDPEDTSLEAEFVAGAMKKRETAADMRARLAGGSPPRTKETDLRGIEHLGEIPSEEAMAILARRRQKKD